VNKTEQCLKEIENYFLTLKKSRAIQIKQEEKLRKLLEELKAETATN